MGKVKDSTLPASKSSSSKSPAKSGAWSESLRRVGGFFANLGSVATYKPLQGWWSRLYTGIGLAFLIGLGIYRFFQSTTIEYSSTVAQYGVPALLAIGLGWFIYRLLQFPPFVDFLIATEAEMNKVSWTSREDLKRATSVVLMTVLVMSVYLFGVDWAWSRLLILLGVLKFGGDGAFGSNG